MMTGRAGEAAVAPDGGGGHAVSNRDRVRRGLFAELGFRRQPKVTPEAHAEMLDHLADELAYLDDAALAVLAEMLKTKGEGAARNLWPDRATLRGFAEVVCPRPLSDLPGLRRWFASVEGPRAVLDGTLVATWAYFERRKCPPVQPGARAAVLEQAASDRRRLQIIAERLAAGWGVDPGEIAWAAAHRALEARVLALVDAVREGQE